MFVCISVAVSSMFFMNST